MQENVSRCYQEKDNERVSEPMPITDRLAGPSASRLLTFSGARVARLVGPGFDQQLGSAKNARRAGVQSSSGVKETDESDGRVNKLRYEPVKERARSILCRYGYHISQQYLEKLSTLILLGGKRSRRQMSSRARELVH